MLMELARGRSRPSSATRTMSAASAGGANAAAQRRGDGGRRERKAGINPAASALGAFRSAKLLASRLRLISSMIAGHGDSFIESARKIFMRSTWAPKPRSTRKRREVRVARSVPGHGR
jgi:hypothetical protein